ncbi:MAG: hypothetical protein WCH31_03740 [Actinomycetes bacterium]
MVSEDPPRPLKIELLWWEGCPSHPEALALLEDVVAELDVAAEIVVREIRDHDEAVAFGFPGSPTIRVDGRDVDPSSREAPASLSCRVYRLPDGRPSPVPSRTQLEDALR